MQTSANGVASLEQEEALVLRAYCDPGGHLDLSRISSLWLTICF
jgi:hypothetical protein